MGLRKNNALQFLEDKTSDYSERVAVGMKTALGWNEFTYSGLGMLSRKLGHYFINGLMLQKGERVAILSESMPEYGACVFGSVLAGLVTVPLDIKLTEYELQSILSDCEPTVMLVSKALVDNKENMLDKISNIAIIVRLFISSSTWLLLDTLYYLFRLLSIVGVLCMKKHRHKVGGGRVICNRSAF